MSSSTLLALLFERPHWTEKAEIHDKRQHHAKSFGFTPNHNASHTACPTLRLHNRSHDRTNSLVLYIYDPVD